MSPASVLRRLRRLVRLGTTPDGSDGRIPTSWRRPLFIGGTGRSGTWALGRLVGAPAGWTTIRTELRFHASQGGMVDLLRGELTPQGYVRRLEQRWYAPRGGGGDRKGLQVLVDEDRYCAAVAAFAAQLRLGLPYEAACQTLFLAVVSPYLREHGVRRWAETTPDNAAAAGELQRVFPAARFVHTVRDGRDVAASVLTMPWGPSTPEDALDWWEQRLRAADAGITACHPERRHIVRLEQLVITDREPTFTALVDFLAPDDAERAILRTHFDRHMTASAAHVGRWRTQLDADAAARFDTAYRRTFERLARDDVSSRPLEPDAVDQLAAAT